MMLLPQPIVSPYKFMCECPECKDYFKKFGRIKKI